MNLIPATLKAALGLSFTLLVIPLSYGNTACPTLMILERTTNSNRVWYVNNLKNQTAPIEAKWEMREKGPNQWEALTSIERNKAYGIKIAPSTDNSERNFKIAGVQSITFTLKTDEGTGCPYVSYFPATGPEMNVQRIKLTMKKTLFPSATKAAFFGLSLNDGRSIETEIKL